MTLLAILMACALALNVLLAVAVIRSTGDLQRRFNLREELDASWRDSMLDRMRRLEDRAKRSPGGQARTTPKPAPERRSGHGR